MELELETLIESKEVLEQTRSVVFGRKEKNYLESLESGGIEELIDGLKARTSSEVDQVA